MQSLLSSESRSKRLCYDWWKKLFWSASKNRLRAYGNIQNIATAQENHYTAVCLLHYPFSKDYYNMIAIDLSKKQALETVSKAIQQINFNGNVEQNENTNMLFIVEEVKETILGFSQGTMRVI